MIRISGGRFKGQTLKAPEGKGTRPTSAARREALFNMLLNGMGFVPERVLDLFAGTGALGIEALSQGAHSCVFVEAAPEALLCLRQNFERLALSPQEASVIASNRIKEWGEKLAKMKDFYPFDLILCDPPYQKGLSKRAMDVIGKVPEIFTEDAVLVLELAFDEDLPTLDGWNFLKERKHGQGKLCLFSR
ncbi:16S rRNA (guanine(966)-N(2))-methyltransferase RsmD [bacterium]|nr:16S rRNA (guanine(966)-N(2))-methyltransferase RsmD [bacterium]